MMGGKMMNCFSARRTWTVESEAKSLPHHFAAYHFALLLQLEDLSAESALPDPIRHALGGLTHAAVVGQIIE